MDSVSGVGVLDKSVAILGALIEDGPASLAELVQRTGLARPTVHRLAVALEHHGLVGRDPQGRFRAGWQLFAWSALAASAVPLVAAAQPVLDRLRDETGESAQLYVRDGARRICVAAAERPTGLRDTVPVGASLPLDAGSGGTVLRTWDGPGGPAPTWVASVAEREPGVASVSAPVLDQQGRALGAVCVSGPIDRLGRRPGPRFGPAVVAAAAAIGERTRGG